MGIEIVHIGGPAWALKSSYFSPKLVAVAKSTPGMAWDAPRRFWTGYADAVATVAQRLQAEFKIPVAGSVEPKTPEAPTGLAVRVADLYDFQQTGVRYLVTRADEGVLLSDDMGLGKTAQALRAAKALGGPVVVVCPAFVMGVWAGDTDVRVGRDDPTGEIAKWWPEAWPPAVLEGVAGSPIVDQPLVTIVNYACVHAWAPHLNVKTLILDEIHYCQSSSSRRSKGVAELAAKARYRIGMTGTPLTNRIKDLHNVVETLSPGRFGKFFSFALRYCDAHQEKVTEDTPDNPGKVVWKFDGRSHEEELHARLDHFMLRRTKEDVALQLPPKTRQVVYIDVPRAVGKRSISALGGNPSKLDDKAARRALELAADAKIPHVVELVADYLAARKAVIYTHRVAVAEHYAKLFAKLGFDAAAIHGGQTRKARDGIIKRAPQVLAATIDVTAGGISLTHASLGVFAEYTYEPHELLQCEARQDRPGQKEPTLFLYTIGRATVDELIKKAVIDRLKQFEKVIGKIAASPTKTLEGEIEKDRKAALMRLAAAVAERGR